MRVLASAEHPTAVMDPFGFLPCDHDTVVVHILDADTLGEDLVECPRCRYVITLADLYRSMVPPAGPGGAAPRAVGTGER